MEWVTIRNILLGLAPLLLCEMYLRATYRVGLLKIISWWTSNYTSIDHLGPLCFISLFLVFAVWATLGHAFQSVSMAVFGKEHSLIYHGNMTGNIEAYTDKGFQNVYEYHEIVTEKNYNLSFLDLYKEVHFTKDGEAQGIGIKSRSYSLFSTLSSLLLFSVFIIPFLGLLHAWIYPVVEVGQVSTPSLDPAKSFEILLLNKGLLFVNKKFWPTIIVWMLGSLFLWNFIGLFESKAEKNTVRGLPVFVVPNASIIGFPVSIRKDYFTPIDSRGRSIETDSGFRFVVFRFVDGFDIPVYVSMYLNGKDFPEMEKDIERCISKGMDMNVLLDDNLTIKQAVAQSE